jgi:hypothetical protein
MEKQIYIYILLLMASLLLVAVFVVIIPYVIFKVCNFMRNSSICIGIPRLLDVNFTSSLV